MSAADAERTIVVVAGGDAPPLDDRVKVPAGALVIAADSGIDHAHALGLTVDVAVGDFDSVTPSALARIEREGAVVERHPTAKDATDLELALDAAAARRPARVIVVGGYGGRLDHLLANALLLAAPRYADLGVVAHMGGATLTVVRGRVELAATAGTTVSLLAIGGPAGGVTTEGLMYPLQDAELLPGSTRGVSNELLGPTGAVTVTNGVAIAVQPALTPQETRHP